jgi:hypothetical protein
MKYNSSNQNLDKQRNETIGAMRDVGQQIAALAPPPDKPGQKSPEFVKEDARARVGDDRDAILGSLLFEAFFGCALGELFEDALNVPQGARELDWGNAIDIYDEYINDRYGNQNYALGRKSCINGPFNHLSSRAQEAYEFDLPQREKLEQTYASLSRRLDYLSPAA